MEINKNAAVEIHLNYNKPKPHKNPKNGQGSLYQGETVEKDDVCFSPGASTPLLRVYLPLLFLDARLSQLVANALRGGDRLENATGVNAMSRQMSK